jgi:hypothetical protein
MIFTGRVRPQQRQQVLLLCAAENVFLFDLPCCIIRSPPRIIGQRHGTDERKKNETTGREQRSHRSISLAAAAEFCAHCSQPVDDLTAHYHLSLSLTVTAHAHTYYIYGYCIILCILYCRAHRREYNPFESRRRRRKMSPFVRYVKYTYTHNAVRPRTIYHRCRD